jgi:hypothetical protein
MNERETAGGGSVRASAAETVRATRVSAPGSIAALAARRVRPASPVGEHGRAMIIAADHPARGALGAGGDPLAMADRAGLLDRLCLALERPGVTGVMATADILEDLLILGVLDGMTVIGSMNRGGLAGSTFEIDDRFTCYDARGIAAMGFDGGKTLTRIALEDPATPSALADTANAVTELSALGLLAVVEPFLSRWSDGTVHNDLSEEAVIRSATIAAGLGCRSAYTWLKLPVLDDMSRVLAATTLPVLLLGGDGPDTGRVFARWGRALRHPTALGLIPGRSLLYPRDGDVAGAVDRAVGLL